MVLTSRDMGTVILVGSAGVLGRALAKDLHHRGCHLIGWDRTETAGENDVKVDLAISGQVSQAMTALMEEHPGPYCFVMAQGAHELSALLDLVDDDIVAAVLAANFHSVVNLLVTSTKVTLPPSRFILVGSLSARTPIPFSTLYSASKAAADVFLQSAGYELDILGHSWCVVEVGGINTGFNERGRSAGSGPQEVGDVLNRVAERIHSRHGMSPEYVAERIANLVLARRVKPRYIIGFKSKVSAVVAALLGIRGQRLLVRVALLRSSRSDRHWH